tara:strand:+ start:3669 stop:3785 length:117 start_codon:yes stop_codon:yes gene_type:complete
LLPFPQKSAFCGVFGNKEIDTSLEGSPTGAIAAGEMYV